MLHRTKIGDCLGKAILISNWGMHPKPSIRQSDDRHPCREWYAMETHPSPVSNLTFTHKSAGVRGRPALVSR